MQKKRTKLWLSLLVTFVVASAVFIDLIPYLKYRQFYNEIRELAPVGSDWTQAHKQIEARGYFVEMEFNPIGGGEDGAYVTDADIRRCPMIIRAVRMMRVDVKFGSVTVVFHKVDNEILSIN